jgi:protein-tyrosine phosphatase
MKVLMVCLGNICRSPLAEGILHEKIKRQQLDWAVDSAGTGAYHVGQMPDPRSVAVADQHGIDISGQRARQFHPADFDRFDLILVMDSSNYNNVLKLAESEEQSRKVRLIMDFVHPGSAVSVPDPYWNDDGFQQVYEMLHTACDKIIDAYVPV